MLATQAGANAAATAKADVEDVTFAPEISSSIKLSAQVAPAAVAGSIADIVEKLPAEMQQRCLCCAV